MTDMVVAGTVAEGFESVQREFARVLASSASGGAALSVTCNGERIVNLWSGVRDKAGVEPWREQTRVNIFSAGKGLVALAILQLVDAGKLDLDTPVADLWPAFAANGKAHVSVRQVLCHRAGLNAFHQPVVDAVIFDRDKVLNLIEQESPWWLPGEQQGYSPILFGWILAEIVRRVSGSASFNTYFEQHINRALGLTISFGVPASEQASLADVAAIRGAKPEPAVLQLGRAMKDDPNGVVNRAFTNPMSLMMGTNSSQWRSAEIPAANGQASAVDLAAVYGSLSADELLLSSSTKPLCWQRLSEGADLVLQTPMRFSHGFMLSQDGGDRRLGRGERAFGHAGAGGCLGFADPDYRLGFAFVSNQMAQSLLIDSRGESLINALYEGSRALEQYHV